MTGTLEHRASRSADRLVLKGETRAGRYRERERQGEDSRAKEPATIGQCGAQGWPSIAKVLKGGMKRDEWQEK